MPEGGAIRYSTRDSRFGPIASTYVGRWPCLDPAQEANFEGAQNLYPIERTSAQETCTIDIDGAPVLDNRYLRVEGIQISEYDVQKASGVLDKISALPRYSESVPDVSEKKKLYYNFFVKPASLWTCSKEKMRSAIDVM